MRCNNQFLCYQQLDQICSNDERDAYSDVYCKVIIGYKYTDKRAIDNDIDYDTGKPKNPEGWVHNSFIGGGWVRYDTLYTLDIAVDDYAKLVKGLPEYDDDYGNFEIENIFIQAMNYMVRPTESAIEFNGRTFPKGTKGLGYIDIDFSPIYVKGTTCPAKGTRLGEDVEFIANAVDSSAPGTFKFISAKKEVPQSDDPSLHDGPYGSRSDIDRDQLALVVYGDANGDGVINGQDLVRLKKYLANYDNDTEMSTVEIGIGADVNGDGVINGQDLVRLKKYLANFDYETNTSTIVLGPQK